VCVLIHVIYFFLTLQFLDYDTNSVERPKIMPASGLSSLVIQRWPPEVQSGYAVVQGKVIPNVKLGNTILMSFKHTPGNLGLNSSRQKAEILA
jgi:hypothetical protein